MEPAYLPEEEFHWADATIKVVTCCGLIGLLLACGCSMGRQLERWDAARAGAGRWEADPETGAVHFSYTARKESSP